MLILKPIVAPAIWGGDRFPSASDENIGQYYTVGATSKFDCSILNGPFQGQTLSRIYQEHRALFNSRHPQFPLLIAFVDAKQDLSIQIHPDDEYAKSHEDSPSGKEESWIFLEAPTLREIVCGTKMSSTTEVIKAIEQDAWDLILEKQPIQKGDYITIKPQTLHALGAGSFVYEIQQPVDLTYRFYDYKRRDLKGNLRELHLEKSLAVLDCKQTATAHPFLSDQRYDEQHYWTLSQSIKSGVLTNPEDRFTCYTLIEGCLHYESMILEPFQSFILSAHESVQLQGEATLILSGSQE